MQNLNRKALIMGSAGALSFSSPAVAAIDEEGTGGSMIVRSDVASSIRSWKAASARLDDAYDRYCAARTKAECEEMRPSYLIAVAAHDEAKAAMIFALHSL